MLKSFFSKFVILLCFLTVILFSFSNPDYISLGLWPFDKRFEIPLYFLVIIVFTLGFFVGVFRRIFKR